MLAKPCAFRKREESGDNSPGSSFSGVYHVSEVFRGSAMGEVVAEKVAEGGFKTSGEEGVEVEKEKVQVGGFDKGYFTHDATCNESNRRADDNEIFVNDDRRSISGNVNQIQIDTHQKLTQKSENLPKITVCKVDSNVSQGSLSTFGKNIAKKPTKTHLLSPVVKAPVEMNHSLSAGDLERHQLDNEVDSHGNLYMNVDDYKNFFAVEHSTPPVGQWEAVTLKKKPSAVSDYNKETLEALKRVTRKFDSFRMRMLKAKSFQQHGNEGEKDGEKPNVLKAGNKIENDEVNEEHKNEEETILEVLRSHNTKCNDFNRVSYVASQLLERTSGIQASLESMAGEEVSDEEVERVKFFYSSIDCNVFAANCLVDVLVSVKNHPGATQSTDNVYRWVQVWAGVPVLILNKGNHPRKPRELIVALAERETGLPLWKEKITYGSDYREADDAFSHLLNESGSGNRILKLRWSRKDSAKVFFERFKTLTSDQNDAFWMVRLDRKTDSKVGKAKGSSSKPPMAPFKTSDLKSCSQPHDQTVVNTNFRRLSTRLTNRHFEKSKKKVTYKKQDISVPCDLKEMTRVDPRDRSFRSTFAGLLPVQNKVRPAKRSSDYLDNCQVNFRPRLPTN